MHLSRVLTPIKPLEVTIKLYTKRTVKHRPMSSMSIPSSTGALKISIKPLPYCKLLPTLSFPLKPFISSFPHSLTSFKSISFQKLPTKIQSLPSSSSSSLQAIDELPSKLQEIIKLFQAVDDSRAKYQQLLFYANNLPPLDEKYKTEENKVEGCVSQVWVRAFLDEDSKDKVYYEADSDSVMTKGLAALLVQGLSGQSIDKIAKVTPDFVTLLGLQQTLTPSRNNGFLNMLRLMQRKAVFLGLKAQKEGSFTSSRADNGGASGPSQEESLAIDVGGSGNVQNGAVSEMGVDDLSRKSGVVGVNGSFREERSSLDMGRIENGGRGGRIREVLERESKPVELEIEDVSYQHAGHAGVSGSNGETHFNLKIVCNEFEGKSLVKRHRMIYGLLQDELQGGLHALSIVAKTPAEVEQGR